MDDGRPLRSGVDIHIEASRSGILVHGLRKFCRDHRDQGTAVAGRVGDDKHFLIAGFNPLQLG